MALIIPAYADQIGISLSTTCITLIKAGMKGCPTYDEIAILFPDTTNQNVSGELKTIDGIIQRDHPQMINSWKYYNFKNSTLWIDPPQVKKTGIKLIVIEPSLPEYKIGLKSLQMNNYTISFGKDRYINANCSEIKITAKNWVFLLGDTMNFLKHNCDPKFTLFNGTVSLKFEKSYQDISTSFKWKHDNWVAENLIRCKTKGC